MLVCVMLHLFWLTEVLLIEYCEEQKEYVMYFIGFSKYMVTVGNFASSKEERGSGGGGG